MPPPKKPHLTRDEERVLSARAQKGDVHARHALVEAHYAFVVWVAARYAGRGVSTEEMIQAGVMGLLEAIDRDNLGPIRLLTFGFWTIRRRIIDCICDATVFSGDHAVRYSLDSGLIPDELRHPMSVDQLLINDDLEQQTLGATIVDEKAVDPSDAAMDHESARIAKRKLGNMKKRTRQIVQMRLGLDPKKSAMSFVDIGRRFNISAERARRVYLLAIRKLQRKLDPS